MSKPFLLALSPLLVSVRGRWGVVFAALIASIGLSSCGGDLGTVHVVFGPGAPDTTAPSTPTGLTATAVSTSQINLSWTASIDNVAVTGYRVYRGGTLLAVLGNVTTFQNTGLTLSTLYSYTVLAVDGAGNESGQSAAAAATTLAVPDTTPPVISSGQPTGTLPGGTTQATMSVTSNETATCKWDTSDKSYSAMLNTFTTTVSTSHSTILTGLSNGGSYTRYVRCQDGANPPNANVSSTIISFNVANVSDTTPPTVSSTTPANAATGVALNSSVSATFSEAMTNSTLTTVSFTLTGGAAVTGTVNVSGNTATFTPSANLAASTLYTATITTAAKDAAGNALAANFTWNFTTGVAVTAACPVGGPPALSVVASRASGVAPLAVFFDATLTTSPLTSRPFEDIEYRWNFGDPGSGSWTVTPNMPNLSRNTAMGPVAAHVFESPGTYTIDMTAFDGTNTASCSVQVTVQDPDVVFAAPNTICFSNSSDFTGCPNPNPAQRLTTSNFTSAINNNIATGKRLLFKRGDTFTAGSTSAFTVTGPGIIGAFGTTGAKPIINVTLTSGSVFSLSGGQTPTLADWRFMDLDIRGNNRNGLLAFVANGGFDQLTFLRLNIQDLNTAFEFSSFILDLDNGGAATPHHVWDQIAVVDSTISGMLSTGGFSGGYGAYISARRSAWMGNSISNMAGGEHGLRIPYASKFVVSHNAMNDAAPFKQAFTLRGPCRGGTGGCDILLVEGASTFTEYVVVSDNKFSGGNFDWTTWIGPQNGDADERFRHNIYERNWFKAGAGTQIALVIFASDVTVRNNICDASGGLDTGCFSVKNLFGASPNADGVAIYNNTFYSSTNTGGFYGVELQSNTTNSIVKNNLAYAPADSQHSMITGTGTRIALNNSTNSQVQTRLPGWISATPSIPADFDLAAGSFYINIGVSVPVFSDFFRRSRPASGGFDLGAAERP